MEEDQVKGHVNGSARPPRIKFDVYIASSWKERERVRALAKRIREEHGLSVFDFTDPECRAGVPEIPPEKFPEAFDPDKHVYQEYLLGVPEWRVAVLHNRLALDNCRAVILLLPCGNDSHADWAYAVGKGVRSAVVGQPRVGERTPSHLWAPAFCRNEDGAMRWLADEKAAGTFSVTEPARIAVEQPWNEEEQLFAMLCVAALRLSFRPREERDGLKGVIEHLGEERVRRAVASIEWLKGAGEEKPKLIVPGA